MLYQRKYTLALVIAVVIKTLVVSTIVEAQARIPIPDDPIEYTGHGNFFDAQGSRIELSLDFIDNALTVYQTHLVDQASPTQLNQLQSLSARVLDDTRALQDNLVVKAALVNWLASSVFTIESVSIQRRITSLNNALQWDLSAAGSSLYEAPETVQAIIDAEIPASISLAFSITTDGDGYIEDCRAAGVPIPPDWGLEGPGQWVDQGILLDEVLDGDGEIVVAAQEFIDQTREAQVFTYESEAPDGVCIALPRAVDTDNDGEVLDDDDIITPLGIICLGRETSNACFWDATDNGVRFEITKGEVVKLEDFAGGAELALAGDVCTECHAGENPFTIHPGTALQPSGISLKSADWYNPLVVAGWPQNAGPANNVDSIAGIEECTRCHQEGGSGGRFPQLSTRITGYCGNVLNPAVRLTMPTSGPGLQENSAHVIALRELCSDAPVPLLRIEEATLDFGEVETGFAYTRALLIHNDGDAPLTVESLSLTTVAGSPELDHFSEITPVSTPTIINPGDPPLTLRQTFEPMSDGSHTITMSLQTSVSAVSQAITLTGSGRDPTPIDTVLILDRSGSMAEYAGDRSKITAMRDASSAYMDLLRDAKGTFTGDRLGMVRYNAGNSDYVSLDTVSDTYRSDVSANKLSNSSLSDIGRLKPDGGTGIGGAMERGANMLGGPVTNRRQVLIVMTDGEENQAPFIDDVLVPITSANAQMQLYSVGVGDDIEPDKLQNITNQGDAGYHQVSASLDAFAMFDLETFYFKIFANAAGLDLAVDPTHSIDLNSSSYMIVDDATVISSDRSATFIVLEDPALKGLYELEFLSPKGESIVPGSAVGSVPVQIAKRHTYTIYKIVFPDRSNAESYTGKWVLRLKPTGQWNPNVVRNLLAESDIQYSSLLQPLKGQVPIGFAAAVGSNYSLDVAVKAENYFIGTPVMLESTLTDRRWPSPQGEVAVTVTYPDNSTQVLELFDDASGVDTVANDGVWGRRLTNTALPGVYRFLFRSIGENLRGERAPREAVRYLTLTDPKDRANENCLPELNQPCSELKRRVRALDDALMQAFADKDSTRIKRVYGAIEKLLQRQRRCADLANELLEAYQAMFLVWAQNDQNSMEKLKKTVLKLLRPESSDKNCEPVSSGTCLDVQRKLVRTTRALVEQWDLHGEIDQDESFNRIKKILNLNSRCDILLNDLPELYEQFFRELGNDDHRRSDEMLSQIHEVLSQ